MNCIAKAGLVVGTAAVLAFAAMAQKKNKEELPEAVIHAKYVYVEAYDGPGWDPQVSAEDRRAILDVEQAVRGWGRYVLVLHRSEAEMVLQVRKGRLAEAKVRGGISVDQVPNRVDFPPTNKTETGTSLGVGADVGPADDLLIAYLLGEDGQQGTRLWYRTQKDGLETPEMKLFQRFKDEVNARAAAQARKKSAGGVNPADGKAPAPAPGGAPGATPNPLPNPAPNPPSYS